MTLPAIAFRRQSGRAGRHPFLWVGRDALSLDALSGQIGVLVQQSTTTATDSFGSSVTVNYSQPAWSYVSGQLVTGLSLVSGGKYLGWTISLLPQASCGMVDFVDNGGIAAGGGVFAIGGTGASGARLYLDSSGTQYRLTYTDGATTKTSTMSGTAPTSGQRVRLRWTLTSAGVAQLYQSINGAAETTGSTPTSLALPAAWGATSWGLNIGNNTTCNNIYLGAVVMVGNQTQSVTQAPLT